MTRQLDRTAAPAVLARARDLVQPALEVAVDQLADAQVRLITQYQFGWCDPDGQPTDAVGKMIRPCLAVLSSEAVLGTPDSGVPGAVAVELVHNFSLLHDDVMDRDVERRHRPTGWVVFGEGQAILAGNAMLALAVEVLLESGVAGHRSLPCVLDAVQLLISGQSKDLLLEQQTSVTTAEVLEMEAGKTAALLSCATSVGALAAGAPRSVVEGLAEFGHDLGIAFQLVDDILGVIGDSTRTGKSSSSDIRAGKRSAPIVAALTSGTAEGDRLADLLADGPPQSEKDVVLATRLVEDAGGIAWATQTADERLDAALRRLAALPLVASASEQLAAVAGYIVARDR